MEYSSSFASPARGHSHDFQCHGNKIRSINGSSANDEEYCDAYVDRVELND